jgi:thiamine biosynthesis lipoprotein
MAEALRDGGLEDFICYAGGDLFVSGRPGKRPWKLGIQHPRKRSEIIASYEVQRPMAVVTSGDYERFFMHAGRRYHHILDPTTGFPSTGTMSVTLQASSGLLADALSTGVFVLGAEEGLALVERTEGVEATIIDSEGRLHVSEGFSETLTVLGSI